MANRYQTSKIYRIVFNDGKYYIGSTTQELNIRMNVHKTLSKKHTTTLYEHVHKVGWENASITLIENYPCASKDELNKKEKEYRIHAKDDMLCLNDTDDIEDTDSTNNTIYKYGKLYRLICDTGYYYIGCTVSELPFRLNNHKQLSKTNNDPLYVYINSIGWDTVKIELIKRISCYSKGELEQLKEQYIHTLEYSLLCLNHLKLEEEEEEEVEVEEVEKEEDEEEEEVEEEEVEVDEEEEEEEEEVEVEEEEEEETYIDGKIYQLLCIDGHYYYGSTVQRLCERLSTHKKLSKTDKTVLYNHINTIGWDNVSMELVEDYPCETTQQLRAKEDEYITQSKDDPLCLNVKRAYVSKDERKEKVKEYYEENKDEILAYSVQYREEHREEILEKKLIYREQNRTLLCEKQKEYAQQHPEIVHEARKKYYENHKEEQAEYYKEYRKAHQQRIQAKQLEWKKKKREENAEQIAKDRESKLQKRKEKSDARIKKDCDIHLCECGGTYQLYRKSRHDNSKKHTDFVKTQSAT